MNLPAQRNCHHWRWPNLACVILVFIVLVVAGSVLPAPAASPIDFRSQIEPILRHSCFECHAGDQQQSGLRLDTATLMIRGGDRGAAIVPGDSAKSLLYQAISGKGGGEIERMPAEGPPLSPRQIELIQRWIDEGAETPLNVDPEIRVQSDHWSFQALQRPDPPTDESWTRLSSPIDAFVLHRLQAEGIKPSPPADRTTLIRRLSLDLHGLPPDTDQVAAFLSDSRPDAYERLVDRLFASTRYGERWGRHWLDMARYADSNGYTVDGPRSIWKYRDWVVDAFNRDLPFDQFTIEQLAGDLLPAATTDQLIATGFHRNTLINQEGGTDDEQFRVDSVYDRVGTTGTVFLGLTIGCAQCHSHKFDPISQREFYQLFAIFNDCEEPKISVPTARQSAEINRLKSAMAAAEEPLRRHDAALMKGFDKWVTQLKDSADASDRWTILEPIELTTEKGALLTRQDDHSVYVDFSIPPNDVFTVITAAPADQISAIRLEALTSATLPKMGPGRADNGNFVLSEFGMSINGGETSEPHHVELVDASADYAQQGYSIENAIDGRTDTGWSIDVKSGSLNVNREAIFFPSETIHCEQGTQLTFHLRHDHSEPNYLLGRFRLSVSNASMEDLRTPQSIRQIATFAASDRTKQQQQLLEAAFKSTDTARQPLAKQVDDLNRQLNRVTKSIPTTMVMRARNEPRKTHVHLRGNFLTPGALVQPAVPAVLHDISADTDRITRLDFARWLMADKNPLTPRVTVNRYWQRLFGRGIVATENDFGLRGASPSHPELLDWLATEFLRQQWSMKAIQRVMVLSDTYRQTSRLRPDLQQIDPANLLFARQSRLRLEAECIRDAGLAASGLLTARIGGLPAYPPQPEGIYVLTQVKKSWPESQGEARYRRGLYTYLWRSSLYPLLPTFDAPDMCTACTHRTRSNTPLQALTMSNDRSVLEMTLAFSRRVIREGPRDTRQRLRYAFRICLARSPSDQELDRLEAFLEEQRRGFASDRESARAVTAGKPVDRRTDETAGGVSVDEAAAWIALARVLFNLDEFITRE